jgi:putative ABC transport system permease protein
MMLLRLISWPYVKKHLFRCILTTTGIVLGVAVFVGMHTANQSVLYAFNKTVDRIAGSTQLQITAGETGFDEDVLEKAQANPGVRVAVPVIEATVQTGIPGQGNLLVLGVDMTGDRSLRDYDLENGEEDVVDDPLVFLAQPDSIIVSQQFSERTGLKRDQKITMRTMAGPKQFTIRGIMKSGGLASAFGGSLAIMDVYAAQMVFGRGRRFDRIDMAVADGAKVEDVRAALQKTLGPGLQVDTPSARGQQFEALAQIYSMTGTVTSMFALFIGLFLIYNTFAIAVTQRRSEIGLLRALGATRGQVKRLFLLESGIAGVAGSLAGIAVGMLIARWMAAYVSSFVGEVYGVAQRAEEVSADPRLLAFAMTLGVLTSLIAAWLPARDAASVDAVKALQKGRMQVISVGENRLRRWLSVVLLVTATGCVFLGHNRIFFYTGYMLSIFGALLLMPSLCDWLTRLLRPALKLIRPVEGALAADSLLQAPRRTSGTVAALSLSIALVVGLGGIAKSSYDVIIKWTANALNPDFFVTGSQSLTDRNFRFPSELGGEIRQVPGVAEVQSVRTARIIYHDTPVMVVATDAEQLARRVQVKVIEGERATMYARAKKGEGVVVSDNFALLQRLRAGDTLEILSPTGVVRLPVLGIVQDFSDQNGTILIDRELFKKYWHDDTINVFRVYLAPGADAAGVRQELLTRFGERTRLYVLTNKEVKDFIVHVTDQWFGLTYVQIFVAVLVAILGIVNTLTVSIADRRRELGVLQAVGGLRSQIRHTIWMEAVTIGMLGLMVGFVMGAVHLYFILEVAKRDLAGMRLDYRYPWEIALLLIPVMLSAALLSGAGPAEGAVRGSLVEALEYE